MSSNDQKGAIFDMDGVIIDTLMYHFHAWQHVFGVRGIEYTEEHLHYNFGRRDDAIIKNMMGDSIPPKEIEEIVEKKEAFFRSTLKDNIKALPGVVELIKDLKQHGFKLAVGSSAVKENIKLITETLDIKKYFDAVAYGLEVAESKPSPQIFLLAAEKIGIPPQNCVVFEDAVAGVTAAKRGGMTAVAVTNTHPRESLKEADLVVDSLSELNTAKIIELIDNNK
jgi:beta-phosphoglucomutase family hydrolase